MTERQDRPPTEDLDTLTRKWWETSVLDATGAYVWDDEVQAVNAMTTEIQEFPAWALQVRGAMPRYGFEMCGHRWLEGLDDVLRMIGAEKFTPSSAGHCGDVPGWVVDAAGQRAAAVQNWLDGQPPSQQGLDRQVAAWLGDITPEKREAARCYVELLRSYFFRPAKPGDDATKTVVDRWQAQAGQNETVQFMLHTYGLVDSLENRCGFKTIDRLDDYICIIGGDLSQRAEVRGNCNTQLRFVLRDDPARYTSTRGYLWGLYAYLVGRDQAWLLANKPDCAGAAIHALLGVSHMGDPTPLRRWLVASLLKSTKIWCQCALNRLREENVPAYVRDLPDVTAALSDPAPAA